MPSESPPTGASTRRRTDIGVHIEQFWARITEGLELSQLWKQFHADAKASYRLYSRDFNQKMPREARRHQFFHTFQEFSWALLEKLTPARRVLLLLALVLLIVGGGGYRFTNKSGDLHGFSIDLHFYAGILLFVLLMLEIADRVVMKRDLEIARDIQSWLLPATPPQIPGLRLAFATRPANTVAGDFYDVFARPAAATEEARFLLAIADVAGKSIPAALLMATFQASLKTLSATRCSLLELVAGMNRYACTNSQNGLRFTTAFFAEFAPAARTLTYINAGHNAPVLRRSSGAIERLSAGGLPLGIQHGGGYESGSVTLQSGDWLVIFTDGVIEAENAAQEEYGEYRLLNILSSQSALGPSELLAALTADMDAFVAETPQHDDITCMLVKVD